jgi:hypothetical protein
MKNKLFALLTLAWIFSVSSVFAQDAVKSQSEKVEALDQKISESPEQRKLRIEEDAVSNARKNVETADQKVTETPEQLKLRIEEYEIAIEPLKSTSASEITGGSNYEAKKQYLDELVAKWEKLTNQKYESRFKK